MADESESDRIVAALEANGYVLTRAAAALGVGRSTLGRWIQVHELGALIEEKNRRIRRLHETLDAGAYPPAPHERSRQAEDQAANRAAGLCSCGRPPDPLADGAPGKMCEACRERERWKKRRSKAAALLSPEAKAALGI